MLDGSGTNNSFWHFYGALSDVEYWVTVRDTVEGSMKTYHNPAGELCGTADVRAFSNKSRALAIGAESSNAAVPVAEPLAEVSDFIALQEAEQQEISRTDARSGTCVASSTRLCLRDRRFSVTVTWRNPNSPGSSGTGRVASGLSTEDTGFFWFFDSDNIELAVKVLDGRALNSRHWVYWGALSDVEYTFTVTDTLTGKKASYTNPAGSFCGGSDVNAL
jgi:hypothetical protein